MLAGWADEPAFRDRAKRMLDYLLFDYVVETLDGLYGGAHSRVYPRHIMAPARTAAAALGWMLFGLGDYEPSERQVTRHQLREELPERGAKLIALSGYTPPPILERIARARATPYVALERKRTRWRMRHAGPDSFVIGDRRTVPVTKTSYVDPDFILGSSQGGLLQPIQQQTWGLIWRTENAIARCPSFFGCQPYVSAIEGSMYFPVDPDVVTDLITRSKSDYDSPDKLPGGSPYEQVVQSGTALIALQDIPADALFRHITLFFSRDLTHVTEDDSGWIFAQGGPVYIAVRPFVAGEWRPNDWTGFLAGGAGGILVSGDFDEWGVGHRCWVSEANRNGYVVQVAPQRDFPSYSEFMDAVRARPLEFSLDPTPTGTFVALDGTRIEARYGAQPIINQAPVDPSLWPLFNSPFGHSEVSSRQLTLRHGHETLLLDFTDVPWGHSTQPPAPERRVSAPPLVDTQPTLYAAATMTGNQRNTATPSDAGLFARLPSGAWTHTGPRILGVASVAIHPTQPAVKLIASADGIVRTPDDGQSWRKTTGWNVGDVRAIVFDSGNTDLLYAATMWGPLRSADGGQNWTPTRQGLDRLYCQTLVADRAQSGRVLLGMEHGLYTSTDAALTWERIEFPDATVTQLVQSSLQPSLFLAATLGHGTWNSSDGGKTWSLIDPIEANLYAATLAPHDAALMATGGWETGVSVSTDGGQTWIDRSAGLPNRRIFVLTFDPHQSGRLWASTFEQGTFTSDDLGQTWQDAGLHGAYGADFVFPS